MSTFNSPLMGKPMGSSYENQWLAPGNSKPTRRKSLRTDNSKNTTTKSERKAVEDKKRAKRTPHTTQSLGHLELPKKPDTIKHQDLHPAVLKLALLFSQYKIVGSNARCVAVLETFSQVIKDHRPPSSASFIRHIQKHLDPHIALLLSVRNMSLSVRECIRWLKKQIADLVAENPPDEEARQILQDQIARFIRARITMADELIVQHTNIKDGDVVLTFAKSSVVEKVLVEAKKRNVDFKVVVVDSRPLFEGKRLMEKLSQCGIHCTYALISSIYVVLKSVTKVIMGAHAVLTNGSVYSRIGSAAVAMAATDQRIPVIICSETYKFVNRTQVDSLVMNEKGDPNKLVHTNNVHEKTPLLANWKQQSDLNITNLIYDATPPKFISMVVTEIGIIPSTSAPVIWREFNEAFGRKEQQGNTLKHI